MTNPNRSLWRIYAVDPRGAGKVIMNGTEVVVASTESEALLKSGVGAEAAKAGLDISQIDVYAERIAEFIRPRKDTQKVVMAKEGDLD